MVVYLFFALTVPVRWRLLFPTLCWSINTKSIGQTAGSDFVLYYFIDYDYDGDETPEMDCDDGDGLNLSRLRYLSDLLFHLQ
jgi:hypothetical protein